jgi:hypothetical protein
LAINGEHRSSEMWTAALLAGDKKSKPILLSCIGDGPM